MKLKALSDRVIVRPFKPEEKTKGGLIIPDTAKEIPAKGYVIAVGPGKDGSLMSVAEGDLVIYGKYAGQELHYGTDNLISLREDEILAVVDEQ